MDQDRCEMCGRFIRLGPGVSWSQQWSYDMEGFPDLHDETYRCVPCTEKYGVGPTNCAPNYPGNGVIRDDEPTP